MTDPALSERYAVAVVRLIFDPEMLGEELLDDEAREEFLSELMLDVTDALPERLAQACFGSAEWESVND